MDQTKGSALVFEGVIIALEKEKREFETKLETETDPTLRDQMTHS